MGATFKELCLDTTGDGQALGRFWAGAAGLRHEHRDGAPAGDPGDLFGAEEGMGIAMCPVEEAKTVKNRVHLDLHCVSVDDLLSLGATRAEGYPDDTGWTVLLDPEGNELCGFERGTERALSTYRAYELCVDAEDPERITRWWADVFDLEPSHDDGASFWHLEGVPGLPMDYWVFAPVPEPKTVKNRLHWDVYGDARDLLAHGATHRWDTPGWTVLADPEGNEFCVFT